MLYAIISKRVKTCAGDVKSRGLGISLTLEKQILHINVKHFINEGDNIHAETDIFTNTYADIST